MYRRLAGCRVFVLLHPFPGLGRLHPLARCVTAPKGARFARIALIDGAVGAVVAPHVRLLRVLKFTFSNGRIAGIDVVADPERLRVLDLAVLDLPEVELPEIEPPEIGA